MDRGDGGGSCGLDRDFLGVLWVGLLGVDVVGFMVMPGTVVPAMAWRGLAGGMVLLELCKRMGANARDEDIWNNL